MRGVGAFVFGAARPLRALGTGCSRLWRENGTLHERLTPLELENQKLRAAGAENRELRAPRAAGGTGSRSAVEVVALSDEPTPTAATLSAGADLGVKAGDALVMSDGLVGPA